MALTKVTQTLIGTGAIGSSQIASGAISAGHLTNIDTDNVGEGSTNVYFSNARARSSLSGSTGVTYNSSTGAISIGQPVGTSDSVTFGDIEITSTNRDMLHLRRNSSNGDAGINFENTSGNLAQLYAMSNGNVYLDASGEIILDSDSEIVRIYHNGGNIGAFQMTNNDFYIRSMVADKDLVFQGYDGSSNITALQLDMSSQGDAIFNNDILLGDGNPIRLGDDQDLRMWFDGNHGIIQNTTSDSDIYIKGNDGGSTITMLNFDTSNLGKATFSGDILTPGSIAGTTDASQIQLGSGNRAQIFHNSAGLYLRTSTGPVYAQADVFRHLSSDASTDYLISNSSGLNVTTGVIKGPSTLTIDPAAHGNNTGTVIIAGDLQVDGTTTTINSTTVNVDDLNIQLATGAANGAAAAGAGITVDRGSSSDAYFKLDTSGDIWNSNLPISISNHTGLGIGGDATSFGSGVSTILLKGTSANGRAGALWFKEHDGSDVTALYSTDGADGYGTVLTAYQGKIKLGIGGLAAGDIAVTIDTNKFVGIGQPTPGYPLEISSTSTVSLAWQRTGTGVTAKKWGFDSDNAATYLLNLTDNNRPITILNSGRIGFGPLTPSGSLHVTTKDSGGADVFIVAQNTTSNRISGYKILDESGSIQGLWRYDNGGNYASLSVGTAAAPTTISLGESSTGISFTSTATSFNSGKVATIRGEVTGTGHGNLAFDTFKGGSGGGERMVIMSGGNVGINETNPSHLLEVVGTSADQTAVVKITRTHASASNNTYTFEVDSSSHTSNMTSGGAMAVDVNGGRALTVNGMGTTVLGGSTTAGGNSKLTINYDIASSAANLAESKSIHTMALYPLRNGTTYGMYLGNAGSNRGYIQVTEGTNGGDLALQPFAGSVGIGTATATPRTKLDVRGEISVDYNATYGLRFYNQPGNNWSSIGNTKTNSAANMVFKDSTGQVMELADGKIYIGTAANGSGQAVNAQNWIHANGLNLDIKGNDDVRFLGDSGTVIGRFTYQSRLAVGADAPVVPLDIQNSTFGLPDASGTGANGMVRIGYANRTWGGNEIFLGIINDGSKDYAGYIQCKVPTNQATHRPLLLNPQGGGIGIGRDTVGKKLDVQATGNTDGIRITGAYANTSLIIQNTGSGGNAWDISSTGASHGYGEGALHFGVAFNPPKLILRGDGKIGMNLTTAHLPQTMLDVQTSNNSFVSVGIAPISVGQYAGIHFGYKENNTSYRKSAIVFKRTDKTSNDAQGQVHFLNGPQGSAGSATLADSKMVIHEDGNVTTPSNAAFRAWLSTEHTTNGTITSGWTDSTTNGGVNAYDVGNDFNTTTGRFTAPCSGVYHFDLAWDSNSSDAQLNIYVVGTGHSGYLARWEPTGATNQGWETRSYSTDAYLEEGDYVYLIGAGASGSYPFHMGAGYWGWFNGHLVG